MTNSENDVPKSQTPNKNIEGLGNYEDEINLIDYFVVLWKRKYFIFLVAVLPALIVGIILFYLPKNYKVTYVYDVEPANDISLWNLNEKNYNLLFNRFYSEENSKKLIDKLQKNGLEGYVKQINGNGDLLKEFVEFEAFPHFLDLSKLNVSDPDQLNKIRNIEALLLNVTIIGKPEEDMHKISSVIRDNIENVMPLYIAQGRLSAYVEGYNKDLAGIERNRFNLELALKNNNEVLAGLKKVNAGITGEKQDNIILQFNVGEQSQYLPLSYQIQAAESKRIELEESIKANEERYKYYKDLLDLNNRILVELGNKLSSDYTVEQFKSFLTGFIVGYEKQELKDYISSYIRKIENRIAASKPITEKPTVYPIARGTVKKSGAVFVVALMISVFTAFLREGLEKNKARVL